MKNLKKNISLSYVYNFLNSLSMQNCIWVLYLGYMGMSLTQIGLLEGMYHATSIVCEVPSGAIADLWGRKSTMVLGRICVFVSCILMLFGRSFAVFAVAFIIQAFGNNMNSGADEALVYDSMKELGEEEKYISVSGRINTVIEVSSSCATVMGGILAEHSYAACYGTSCVLSFLTILSVAFMSEPNYPGNHGDKKILKLVGNHFSTCGSILRGNRKLRRMIIFFNVLEVAATVMFFYGQEYYNSMGLNKIEISLVMLASGICSSLGAFFSDKIYAWLGRRTLIFAVIIEVISVVLFLFYKFWLSLVCFTLVNFVTAVLYPVRSSEMNKLIPSEQRATLISADSLVFSVGMIMIFPAVGFVADLIVWPS